MLSTLLTSLGFRLGRSSEDDPTNDLSDGYDETDDPEDLDFLDTSKNSPTVSSQSAVERPRQMKANSPSRKCKISRIKAT